MSGSADADRWVEAHELAPARWNLAMVQSVRMSVAAGQDRHWWAVFGVAPVHRLSSLAPTTLQAEQSPQA